MMMLNIVTGRGSITRRDKQDIVLFVSSVHRLREMGLPFLLTNQHAYHMGTEFYDSTQGLEHVDWELLQRHGFKTSDTDPGKQLRYQAEVLVHQHVPLRALHGIVCYSERVKQDIEALVINSSAEVAVRSYPKWYF